MTQHFWNSLPKCVNLLTKDNVYAENEEPKVCESLVVS